VINNKVVGKAIEDNNSKRENRWRRRIHVSIHVSRRAHSGLGPSVRSDF